MNSFGGAYKGNKSMIGDRDESAFRREYSQVTAEVENVKPMFPTGQFNNRIFNNVFEHHMEARPRPGTVAEPSALMSSRLPLYGSAHDGGQTIPKEDQDSPNVLDRVYQSHRNPTSYSDSLIKACRNKKETEARPISKEEITERMASYHAAGAPSIAAHPPSRTPIGPDDYRFYSESAQASTDLGSGATAGQQTQDNTPEQIQILTLESQVLQLTHTVKRQEKQIRQIAELLRNILADPNRVVRLGPTF